MMVPMKQPITEQTGKVVVANNTNQFYEQSNISLALSAIGNCPLNWLDVAFPQSVDA